MIEDETFIVVACFVRMELVSVDAGTDMKSDLLDSDNGVDMGVGDDVKNDKVEGNKWVENNEI